MTIATKPGDFFLYRWSEILVISFTYLTVIVRVIDCHLWKSFCLIKFSVSNFFSVFLPRRFVESLCCKKRNRKDLEEWMYRRSQSRWKTILFLLPNLFSSRMYCCWPARAQTWSFSNMLHLCSVSCSFSKHISLNQPSLTWHNMTHVSNMFHVNWLLQLCTLSLKIATFFDLFLSGYSKCRGNIFLSTKTLVKKRKFDVNK